MTTQDLIDSATAFVGFLDARPESSPIQNLRMLVAHPLTAVSYARARSRA